VQIWLDGELQDGGHADPQEFHTWFLPHCGCAIIVPVHTVLHKSSSIITLKS